jgi:hypothetical protein
MRQRQAPVPGEIVPGLVTGSCARLDVEELQKKGLEPLKPALDRIAALNGSKGIATLIGEPAAGGNHWCPTKRRWRPVGPRQRRKKEADPEQT